MAAVACVRECRPAAAGESGDARRVLGAPRTSLLGVARGWALTAYALHRMCARARVGAVWVGAGVAGVRAGFQELPVSMAPIGMQAPPPPAPARPRMPHRLPPLRPARGAASGARCSQCRLPGRSGRRGRHAARRSVDRPGGVVRPRAGACQAVCCEPGPETRSARRRCGSGDVGARDEAARARRERAGCFRMEPGSLQPQAGRGRKTLQGRAHRTGWADPPFPGAAACLAMLRWEGGEGGA